MPRKYTPDEWLAAFHAKVDRTPGQGPKGKCHEWAGYRNKDGYGMVSRNGRMESSHRVAWELANGRPVPEGMCVLHSCDWPPCCNAECLFVGTHADNMADKMAKGRHVAPSGDANGSRLHPERLPRGDANGSRLHPERRPRGDAHGSRTHPERLARGAANGLAVLSDAAVRDIRSRCNPVGSETQTALAREYGVGQTTVSKIINRKIWRHI